MSSIKGMGSCVITQENGYPCGRQIGEGEAIGTVVINGAPYIGHKRCADAYDLRSSNGMVKRADQTSPGGAVGPMRDAVAQDGRPDIADLPQAGPPVSKYQLPDGVKSLSELPYDEPTANPGQDLMAGLTADERRLVEEHRRTRKPDPVNLEVTLPRGIPDNADLVIHIKR
jgi:hypothetical protein